MHRAILHSGEKVVVKVQRPGLKKLFDIDLSKYHAPKMLANRVYCLLSLIFSFDSGNLKLIAEYFQKSETLGGPTRYWIGIYEECAK